jgi:hypothetical protein
VFVFTIITGLVCIVTYAGKRTYGSIEDSYYFTEENLVGRAGEGITTVTAHPALEDIIVL